MLEGVACALAAGLLWGAVFVAPVLFPDYLAGIGLLVAGVILGVRAFRPATL